MEPWGAGLLSCWAPITEHPVPTFRQRRLQGPLPAPDLPEEAEWAPTPGPLRVLRQLLWLLGLQTPFVFIFVCF